METKKENKTSHFSRVLCGVGIVLCVIFGFLLLCNITIIIKGSINPETPPSLFGTTPMVVLSGSMSGNAEDHIEVGDLIFISKADPNELNIGDVIAFSEESSTSVVTHRIVEITKDDTGSPVFITKGDANNVEDQSPVTADRLIGIYKFRIAGVGNFALFLQTPTGMLLFIGVPLLAFIIYDILRRQHYAKKEKKNAQEMEEELEKLRAIAYEKNSDE